MTTSDRETRIDRHVALAAATVGVVSADGSVVLDDVALDVDRGRIVAVVGASGAGKTTLLDVLAGNRRPTSGSVALDGIDRVGPAALRRAVGFVPQHDVLPDLPLRELMRSVVDLRAPAISGDGSHGDAAEVADTMIDRLGLASVADVMTSRLSSGERRRTSIGVELLRAPSICVIDEPTAGLDPTHAAALMAMLVEIARAGTTIVMSTHRAADVRRCDRVVALAPNGTKLFDGTVDEAAELVGTTDIDRLHRVLTNGYWTPPDGVTTPADGAAFGGTTATGCAEDGPTASVGLPLASRRVRPNARLRRTVTLARRTITTMRHAPMTLAIMVGSPAMVIAMFAVLFRPGAFVPGAPGSSSAVMTTFWIAFGSFFFGLTYGLLQISPEVAWMRRDWRSGVGAGAQILVKFAVLLPVLVAVNVVMLGLLRVLDRIPPLDASTATRVCVVLALDGAAGLALGLATSAAVRTTAQAALALPLICFPAVLFSGAIVPTGVMPRTGRVISVLWPDRWAFESIGASLEVRRLLTDPARIDEFATTWTVDDGAVITILASMTLVALVAAVVILERRFRAPST